MRVLCALAVVCLLVRVELSSGQCPTDFQLVNNKCYKFSTSNAARDQAATTCQGLGAQLVSPQDSTQQAAVENLLRFGQASWEYTWTSLKEQSTSWRWDFSNAPVDTFTSECFTRASGSNLYELTYMKNTSFTSDSCNDACRSWLGDRFRTSAVTVKTCTPPNEGAALCLNNMQAACFCGTSEVQNPKPASCNTPCPQNTALMCGAPDSFYRTKAVSSGWAPGQPKLTDGNELCMALGYGNEFAWIAKPCSTLMRYACKFEIPTQNGCIQSGKSWFSATGLCFKISTEAYTWFEARELCKSENGVLLQPLTSADFRVQISMMVSAYTGSKMNVVWDTWTAGTATELKWANSIPVSYTFFADRQPNINSGNCIAISKQSSPIQYQWDSRSCQESQPFICETASSTPTTTTTTRAPVRTPAPATTRRPATGPAITPTPPPAITPTPPPAITPTPPPAATSARPTRRIPPTTSREPGFPDTGTTTDKNKNGGGQNTVGDTKASSGVGNALSQLTLGTKIVIGIVAFVVVISIILMVVFICQRRRKESYDDSWNE